MKSCGIYQIKNVNNDKVYIGYSKTIEIRWNNHKHYLRKGIHRNAHLQAAWDKDGEVSFEFTILEHCSIKSLATREHHWTQLKQSLDMCKGYNILPTSNGPTHTQSKETKAKISSALKGRTFSQETKDLWSRQRKGKKLSPEHSRNIGLASSKHRRKPVLDTVTNEVYESVEAAAEAIGVNKHVLSNRLRGARRNDTTLRYLNEVPHRK